MASTSDCAVVGCIDQTVTLPGAKYKDSDLLFCEIIISDQLLRKTVALYSYVIGILRILRNRGTAGVTLVDLAKALGRGEGGKVRFPGTWGILPTASDDENIRILPEKIRPAVQELIDLQIIGVRGEEIHLNAGPPRTPPPDGPTGDEPAPPGGSGLGEVLAHPILFSYVPEDLDQTIDDALEIYE